MQKYIATPTDTSALEEPKFEHDPWWYDHKHKVYWAGAAVIAVTFVLLI